MTYHRAAPHPCPVCGTETIRASIVGPLARLCGRCRGSRRDAERLEEVLVLLASTLPGLSQAVLRRAVHAAAATSGELCQLHHHLASYHDALTSGSSAAPRVICRLVVLLEAEAAPVVRPRCAICGRAGLLVRSTPTGRICKPCYCRTRHKETCSSCGKLALVHVRREGQPICNACRMREPGAMRTCSSCGRLAQPMQRGENGPRCGRCRVRPSGTCSHCRSFAPVVRRKDGRAYCLPCYRRTRPQRPCGRCGRVRPIVRQARDGEPDLCGTCNRWPVGHCTSCGADAALASRRTGLCVRCSAREEVNMLLAGPDGTVPPRLHGLRDAILGGSSPRGVLSWLRRNRGARFLAETRPGLELDHDALEVLPKREREHLRALLVASGALPHLELGSRQLEVRTATLSSQLRHPENRQVFLSYAHWNVLRRHRSRTEVRTASTKHSKHVLSAVARFLALLEEDGRSLTSCRQGDIDRFTGHHPSSAGTLRTFLSWASKRDLLDDLDLPRARRPAPASVPSDDERWALARRFLHDSSLDLADRVAGALVVIYAQPVTRIVRLERQHLDEQDGRLFLQVGNAPLEIPEPLAGLLRQLPHRRDDGVGARLGAQWLFPGRLAGKPSTPDAIRYRLIRLGVQCRAHRSAALLQLGGALPAAVIADLLGVSASTAERWTKVASGTWSNYAASRARIDSAQRERAGNVRR